MKESIIELLHKHSYSFKQLKDIFKVPENKLLACLEELESEGTIVTKSNEYYLPQNLSLKRAKITKIREHFSFANFFDSEEEAYIDNRNLKSALKDDEVFLERDYQDYHISYKVFSIIKRGHPTLVGEVIKIGSMFFLKVRDLSYDKTTIEIIDYPVNLIAETIVLTSIIRNNKNYIAVKVEEVLGSKNDPGMDVLRIILEHGAPTTFPYEVKKEVATIPYEVLPIEKENREDFTSHSIITIDGDDAKDFDDAVEAYEENGIYHVGVHIADVTHYVKEKSSLDKEALSRSTSLYATDRVVPMLPFELSNGICSLNPNVERLVTSCLFTMDINGNILEYKVVKGVIKSYARLTYKHVNNILKGIEKEEDSKLEKLLFTLEKVANIIRKRRNADGALNLESTELKFIVDEHDNPISLEKRTQDIAEELIEDLMITANEIVARIFYKNKWPFIYRIHEQPRAKRMEEFMALSSRLGISCDFSFLDVTPKQLSNYLEKAKDSIRYEVISRQLLRSLAKARYDVENLGHFGLASKCYCHFTSPIRRYPDLMVHRLIDRFIVNKNIEYDKEFINNLIFVSEICSSHERRSLTIEREVIDLMSAKYMAPKVGQVFEGSLVSMTVNGMFVEIDNGIDGFIPFESIEKDFFIYDEKRMMAYGKRSGQKYMLGDRVKVNLDAVNIPRAQINFSLLNSAKSNRIKAKDKKYKKRGQKHGKRKNSRQ